MLQFITDDDSRYPVAEQVKMVIGGGCRWVQLSRAALRAPEFCDESQTIINMCREAGVFLVFTGDVDLCDKLRVHGVHLAPGDMTPREARARLGAHAVIGVTVTTAAEIISLRNADIDYVQVGPFATRFATDDYAAIVAEAHGAGVDIPVVATGDIHAEDVPGLLASGVSGVALSATIMDASDPAAEVGRILEAAQ